MKAKLFKKIALSLILIASLIITISFNVKAESDFPIDQIMYLTASVGETYDHVGISYHTSSDDSYVLYGTELKNGEIVNPIKVEPTSTLWSYDKLSSDPAEYGFKERYVCKATLNNLSPRTKYYYQAVDGSVKSQINSFESLTDDLEKKTFFFLTDIQSSGTGFKNSQTLIDAILAKTDVDPNLVVMTGDQVDRAGIEQQWVDYYKYIPTISNTLQANVPGNHEYYTTADGGYISPEIYNQMTNNPLNGPEDKLGSSYYFKYGNILFIMLDIVKQGYNVSAQQEWFRNVVKNNPSKWIIVGSHPGMYATGAYLSDSANMRKNWLAVFEECQVDLALNGHEHVYARKNIRYGGSTFSATAGEKDEALGVTYLAGGAAGLKLYNADKSTLDDFDYVDYYFNNTGCVITVDGDELTVQRYKASGIIDDEFTLYAKRPDEIKTISDQEILDSITLEYDEENNSIQINWTGDIYGNATNIHISGGNFKGNGVDIPVVTSSLTKKVHKGYFNTNNYYFTVEITKNDGSKLTKDLDLILNPNIVDYNIIFNLNGGVNDPSTPTTFKGINLPLTLSEYLKEPTKEGYEFKGWILNDGKRVTDTVNLKELSDITLTATWEPTITYILNGGTNSNSNKSSYDEEDLPKRLFSPTKEGYIFKGWKLNGEFVTEIPVGTSGPVTVEAIWQKTICNITYILDGGTNHKSNPQTFKSSLLPQKLYNPTKDGYVFKGWLLNDEIVTEIPRDTMDDITLTATWEKSTYNISYVLDSGTNNSSNNTTYDINKLPHKLYNPTKDGYVFKGWLLNGNVVTEIPLNTTGDVTLTATWEKATYNISYVLDGGTNNSSNTTTYDVNKLPHKLYEPTKKKSTFAGWLLNGEIVTEIPLETTGDITLTATWTKAKGCKKSMVSVLISLNLLTTAFVILRKKK